ncbi:MAG: hypothetical protein KF784_05840 [Fimbriimonadaceae bacterium]|nr:hypothetical protein [Fimbriimonadaceae bacterium]
MPDPTIESRYDSPDFPGEIKATLAEVRDRCAAIIEAVCGGGARAKDVSDQFGVHAKLGWQLWNVAFSDPLTSFRFLPNEHGIRLWGESAIKQGVPQELVKDLEDAIAKVRGVIDLHAEDREMFEMLVDAQAELDSDDAEVRWRKQAFTGNSFVFGARAKCVLASAIFYPSDRPNWFSVVRMHGLISLVRTRVGVRWPISTLVVQQSDGSDDVPLREPLAKESEFANITVPFMPKYCTKPLPPVERRSDGHMICDELLPGLVGLTGANTVFTGEILHNIGPAHGRTDGEFAHFGTGVRTPCELLVSDHIVHKSLFPNAKRELRVYGELISSTTRDERDRLDVSEELQHLGSGLSRVRTADVPSYADALCDAFAQIGMDPNEFDIYRVRMRYPPMPASVMVRHELPPPPQS